MEPPFTALDLYCIAITALSVFGIAILIARETSRASSVKDRVMLIAGIFVLLGLPAIHAFTLMGR